MHVDMHTCPCRVQVCRTRVPHACVRSTCDMTHYLLPIRCITYYLLLTNIQDVSKAVFPTAGGAGRVSSMFAQVDGRLCSAYHAVLFPTAHRVAVPLHVCLTGMVLRTGMARREIGR